MPATCARPRASSKRHGVCNPHPDLAEVYINLKPGDSARERLARAEKLADMAPGNVEGALALARAAIDAQSFAVARVRRLRRLLITPTQRVAVLMAELEEAESGNVGRARAWMSRALRATRDPAWTADGFVSDVWLPVSPATGRLDAFEWKVPVADLQGPMIEADDGITELEALAAAGDSSDNGGACQRRRAIPTGRYKTGRSAARPAARQIIRERRFGGGGRDPAAGTGDSPYPCT